jgi:hypothetical protein
MISVDVKAVADNDLVHGDSCGFKSEKDQHNILNMLCKYFCGEKTRDCIDLN